MRRYLSDIYLLCGVFITLNRGGIKIVGMLVPPFEETVYWRPGWIFDQASPQHTVSLRLLSLHIQSLMRAFVFVLLLTIMFVFYLNFCLETRQSVCTTFRCYPQV